jgi:hypothetical protein
VGASTLRGGRAREQRVQAAGDQQDKDTIEFGASSPSRGAVQPGETITVYMPSLSPGTYEFVDDFHSTTPKGAIVAK